MPKQASHRWTVEDETALRDLVEKGFYLRRLALRLGRSESSIKMRARALNIVVKPTPRCGPRFGYRASGHADAHS